MKNNLQTKIQCPINLFSQKEEEIDQLTLMINQVQSAAQKEPIALDLIENVQVLLECQSFDEGNINCSLCQNISQLRLKTYNLVVKSGRVSLNKG
ncbi:MAG: hypothetical protein NTZ74_08640 [Chloroflexi bacterium]|nr:hypothetical protein [Chloroflexota bacterium]